MPVDALARPRGDLGTEFDFLDFLPDVKPLQLQRLEKLLTFTLPALYRTLSRRFPQAEPISIKSAPFADVWAAWPREGNSDLSKALGRDLSAQLADPGCASLIRLSAAFNRCGAAIAKSSAFSGASIIDAAGFQYLADAASAIKLFKGKLGKPRVVSSEADVLGRAGILAFELAAPKGDKGGGHHDRHAHHNAPGGDAGAHTHAHAPGGEHAAAAATTIFMLWDGKQLIDATLDPWKDSASVEFFARK